MSTRPASSMNRPPSAMGRVPQRQATAAGGQRNPTNRPSSAMGGAQFYDNSSKPQRIGTAAARGRVSTAAAPKTGVRPGSRLGTAAGGGRGGGVMNVANRPVTQQGLAGVRPSTKGMGARQVQDKSYYMALLRAKTNELNTEINRLQKDMDYYDKERQNFLVYEKKAEELAAELKQYQGTLSDFNMVVDKMHTNTEASEVKDEVEQLKERNENETQTVDSLFADRRQKEETARQMEVELESCRREAESMLTDMDTGVRYRYEKVKEENAALTEDLQLRQDEYDELSSKKSQLEDELAVSQVKQEAMMLHEKLAEVETKREKIHAELNAEGTSEQKRERLLDKVKRDNEEIATMDKQTNEMKEKIEQCHEELRELDEEFEDQQGEKNQKYRELRVKEQQIDEFLEGFEKNKREEANAVVKLQKSVVKLLREISKNVVRQDKSMVQLGGMHDYDLALSRTKKSSANTVPELQKEVERMEGELERVGEMEVKAHEELRVLRGKMDEMQTEINTFGDVESLRQTATEKHRALEQEQRDLEEKVSASRERATQIQTQVDGLRLQLNENDGYRQMVNLEKKMQYIEQNNFALREVIEAKNAETNVGPVKEQVKSIVTDCTGILSVNIGRTGSLIGSG